MIRVICLLLATLTLQACISVRTNHGYVLERDQSELSAKIGLDTKESVLAKYGEPSLIGTFDRDAWYYLHASDSSRAFFHPKTRQRTVVAFHFSEDGLVEDQVLFNVEDGESLNLISTSTPTRGRELNFWEQLLGNVGRLPSTVGQGQTPGQ